VSDVLIGKPCPTCHNDLTICVADSNAQNKTWSCEICQTVWDEGESNAPPLPEQYNPDHPYPLIVDGSESLPDPSWDYTQIYYRSVALRREVEALFKTLEVDDGIPEVDQAIRDHLRQMSAQINAAMGELD
jgi:hypothetical protein